MGMQSGSSRPMKPSSLWRRKTLSSDVAVLYSVIICFCAVFVRVCWGVCEGRDDLVWSRETMFNYVITLSCWKLKTKSKKINIFCNFSCFVCHNPVQILWGDQEKLWGNFGLVTGACLLSYLWSWWVCVCARVQDFIKAFVGEIYNYYITASSSNVLRLNAPPCRG